MPGNHAQAADLGHDALPPLIHHSHGYTDFTAYSHTDLYNMLFAGDPASIREAAAAWQSTGRMLADQATQLRHKLTSFAQMWQGKAADEYHVMITDLAGGLDKVSDDALAMNNLMASSAEALDTARATMPPPQLVPDLDPTVLAAATAVAPPEIAMMPGAQAQFAASQLQAQQAVQAHQAALDSSQAAQAQAVLVMQKLSTSYGATEDSIPATPESVQAVPDSPAGDKSNSLAMMSGSHAGTVPMLAASGEPAATASATDAALITGSGSAATGSAASASVPDSPLFGHMFTAGLAAASAAAAGRFGSVMPKLPGFLNPNKKKAAKASTGTTASKVAAAAAVARAAALKLGGAGGAGSGLGTGGVGAAVSGPEAPAATAYSGLIGGSGTSGVAGAAAAGQLAGAAAGTPGASGTSMPMMPMGGMAGAGGGDLGGRRIPPWLVETEDVWGESSAVSPPVIGEDF